MTGLDALFQELRKEYLTEAPVRLAELRKDLAAARAGEVDAAASLRARFHRLAGSGGSYGFPDISAASRAAERLLVAHPDPDAGVLGSLEQSIAGVARAFDAAYRELGLPAEPTRRPPFGWQAAVLAGPGGDAERVCQVLADAHFSVTRHPLDQAPGGLPISQRPDVAVLVAGAATDIDPAVGSWAAGAARPLAVVLVTEPEAIDPLAAPFTELDLVVAPARVETELFAFLRALGRSATVPPSITMLAADPTAAGALLAALEAAGSRVGLAPEARHLLELLAREEPDLVLLDWRPDSLAVGLLRAIRRLPGRQALPLVVRAAGLTDADRVAAVRAGADDVLLEAMAPAQAAQLLLARVERSRRVRGLARRDALTGLLNHGALLEELESAIAFAGRTGEELALVVLDVDHFRRVNERHGHAVGNQLLERLAQAVAGLIRSSDTAARLGGEAFGVVIRRCAKDDAVVLAEKLRRAAGGVAVETPEGPVRVRASAGLACFPAHGGSGAALLRAADRALAAAKRSGRDRTAVA